MKYTASQIATLIGARMYGNAEGNIAFLLTDSRSLSFAEETMFFALRSKRNDGHKYIKELYGKGVRNFVVDNLTDTGKLADANFLVVPDTLAALQRLAERHRDEFQIPVVGITGSNGKTVVKDWLYQLLSPGMNVTRSPRSYNSQVGVPLSVWQLREDTGVGIFEAGISQPDEMRRLADIIQPTIGVFTTLGEPHQENFHSLEDKCREKFLLFKDCQTLVYPVDNDVIFRVMKQCAYGGELMGWSRNDASAPFYVKSQEQDGETTVVNYIYKGKEGNYRLPFISMAAVDDSITCAVTALYLGLTPDALAERMQQLEPVAMRLEVKKGRNGCTLINDSYNSDLASLDIALDFMHRRPDCQGRRRTLILSDIDQTGYSTEEIRARVDAMVKSRGIDKLITVGSQFDTPMNFATTDDLIASEEFASLRNEVILIKGARRFGFDRITELLVEKVHETTLEVNLSAVVANYNWYRSHMKSGAKLVCMIKADGYGAGAIEIAKTLQDHRVDYLAVAVADEGVALRQAGITANIMVMNPEMTAFKAMFDYDLEPEVYSFRLLDALRHAARKEGITGWPIHVKLDTGMHRLGFHPVDDMPRLV